MAGRMHGSIRLSTEASRNDSGCSRVCDLDPQFWDHFCYAAAYLHILHAIRLRGTCYCWAGPMPLRDWVGVGISATAEVDMQMDVLCVACPWCCVCACALALSARLFLAPLPAFSQRLPACLPRLASFPPALARLDVAPLPLAPLPGFYFRGLSWPSSLVWGMTSVLAPHG